MTFETVKKVQGIQKSSLLLLNEELVGKIMEGSGFGFCVLHIESLGLGS